MSVLVREGWVRVMAYPVFHVGEDRSCCRVKVTRSPHVRIHRYLSSRRRKSNMYRLLGVRSVCVAAQIWRFHFAPETGAAIAAPW